MVYPILIHFLTNSLAFNHRLGYFEFSWRSNSEFYFVFYLMVSLALNILIFMKISTYFPISSPGEDDTIDERRTYKVHLPRLHD